MLRRLRVGEWLAAAGAVALLAAVLVRPELGVVGAGLMLVALAGLAPGVLAVVRRSPALPLAASVVGSVVGLAGVLLALIWLLDDASGAAYVAVAAALAVSAGCALGVHDETPSIPGQAPEPQLRPTPPAEAEREPTAAAEN